MDGYVVQLEREAVQLIDRVESMGQASLSGLSGVAEQMATIMPKMAPAPFASLIPSPAETVKTTFAVAERALVASRRLAEGFVDAIAPLTGTMMPWAESKTSTKRGERKDSTSGREAA